jgi:hypothetical protein
MRIQADFGGFGQQLGGCPIKKRRLRAFSNASVTWHPVQPYTVFVASTDRTIHVGARTYVLLRGEAECRRLDVDTTADA